MDFYDRLMAETEEARAEFVSLPIIGRALKGEIPRRLYLDFLIQAYHHVCHTCPLLALAAVKTENERYRDALFTYIQEEQGHEQWILEDIRAIGGNAREAAPARPGVACGLMVAYAYYAVEWISPYALLGMVHVLEGMSVRLAEKGAAAFQRSFGLNDGKGVRYLRSHGALDVGHTGFFRSFVNGLDDPAARDVIIHNAVMFYRLYGDMFRELAIRRHEGADVS